MLARVNERTIGPGTMSTEILTVLCSQAGLPTGQGPGRDGLLREGDVFVMCSQLCSPFTLASVLMNCLL